MPLLNRGTLPLLQIARRTARTWRWWTSRTTRRLPTERTTARNTCTFRRRPSPWWYPARPKVSATRSSDCWILCAVAVACFPTTCNRRTVYSTDGETPSSDKRSEGWVQETTTCYGRTGFRVHKRDRWQQQFVTAGITSMKTIIQKSHVSKTFQFLTYHPPSPRWWIAVVKTLAVRIFWGRFCNISPSSPPP